MAKHILTIDARVPQVTNVKRFVLDSSKIVGLFEDVWGNTGVTVKPAEVAQPKVSYVEESFDDLADLLQSENANKPVVTVDHRFVQSTMARFVLDVRKLVGVVETNSGTQLTIKSAPNAVPTIVYVHESFDEIASLYIDGPFDPEMD